VCLSTTGEITTEKTGREKRFGWNYLRMTVLSTTFGLFLAYHNGVLKDLRIQIFRIQRPFHTSRDERLQFKQFRQPFFYLSVIASR
jgi:hypothetical protein